MSLTKMSFIHTGDIYKLLKCTERLRCTSSIRLWVTSKSDHALKMIFSPSRSWFRSICRRQNCKVGRTFVAAAGRAHRPQDVVVPCFRRDNVIYRTTGERKGNPWWRWSRSFDCWWTDAGPGIFLPTRVLRQGLWPIARHKQRKVLSEWSDPATVEHSVHTDPHGLDSSLHQPLTNYRMTGTPGSRSCWAAAAWTTTGRSRTMPDWPGLERPPTAARHVTCDHVTCRGRAVRRLALRSNLESFRWSVVRAMSTAFDFYTPTQHDHHHSVRTHWQ